MTWLWSWWCVIFRYVALYELSGPAEPRGQRGQLPPLYFASHMSKKISSIWAQCLAPYSGDPGKFFMFLSVVFQVSTAKKLLGKNHEKNHETRSFDAKNFAVIFCFCLSIHIFKPSNWPALYERWFYAEIPWLLAKLILYWLRYISTILYNRKSNFELYTKSFTLINLRIVMYVSFLFYFSNKKPLWFSVLFAWSVSLNWSCIP